MTVTPTNSISLKPVGHTGLQVTSMGLGTAPLGNLDRVIDIQTGVDMIHYALDHGVRFIDTAPLYGRGESERRIGIALAGIPRDSYVLATKVGRLITPEREVIFNFSRDGILRSVEDSLKRLQLDRIDILHIHDPDNHYRQALDETYPTLADLRSQGVIKAVGSGMNQWQMLADFARNADFNCFLLAGRYTLLEQTSLDMLKLCQEKGIGIFLGGVYNSGILARGPRPGAQYNYQDAPPAILERVQRIEAVCNRHDVPLNVAAIQFPRFHPAITSIVMGAESAAEVAANIQALSFPIPSQLWEDLRAAGLLEEGAPTPAGRG
ncbi:MAG: aldo/keto reductase [Chloroflexi bacterium]|nr:aldo/keto reductase [Chloroflexota bacterium]